jgi:hypothetical protein
MLRCQTPWEWVELWAATGWWEVELLDSGKTLTNDEKDPSSTLQWGTELRSNLADAFVFKKSSFSSLLKRLLSR